MRFQPVRSLVVAAASTALVVVGLAPAQATIDPIELISGGNPSAGWTVDKGVYSNFFADLADGAPQGTLIADSGFRPYPNGFPIPNWGTPKDFVNTQLVYGLPVRATLEEYRERKIAPPAKLNALNLRRTFGNGVCRDPKAIDPKTGDCELIFGADLLATMFESTALGGHCFGMAAAAAALYNGQLPANQVGASGLGVNATNPMGQPAVQTITRLFGTQIFNARPTVKGPTAVLQTLIRDLPGGTVPYILGVGSDQGGHAVTPFAVLDRGEGIYDVAVYDNNFPMRARAVTINTSDDTFSYTSALNPSAPGTEWSTATNAVVDLTPVADTVATQNCPVCIGENQGTLVTISALRPETEVGYVLLDESGDRLDPSLYRKLQPINPPTEDRISQPVFEIAPDVKFGILVIADEVPNKQSMEIFAISNGEAQYVLLDELVSNSNSLFGVGGLEGSLFESSAPSSPRILQLSDQPGVSFDVNGHPLNLPAGVQVDQQWNTKTERVEYRSNAKKALRWNVQIGGLDNGGGREYVGINVRVPTGGTIVVDYTKASATVAPRAWIRTADGERIPFELQSVTEQLINEYRDDLYLVQGPGE
jgi:hypothetical protein